MGVSVTVNDRTVVHQRSAGISLGFPDVCLTPPNSMPVPYLNLALSKDAADTSATVFADGERIMLRSSCFSRSVGDEPGSDGGIISGCIQGKAAFCNYSFDVKVEGENVPRQLDPMLHNRNCPANALSPAELQADAAGSDKERLCVLVCFCNFSGGRMECVRRMMAQERWGRCVYRLRCRVWDPYPIWAGFWIEVPYFMAGEPVLVPSLETSRHHTGPGGTPMPLPMGDLPPLPGTRRPDVVTVHDPTLPPVPGNIKHVYEIKFPGDTWREGQRKAYERINGGEEVTELSPEECGCDGTEVPVPVPVTDDVKERKPDEPWDEEPISEHDPRVPVLIAVGLGLGLGIGFLLVGGLPLVWGSS